MIINIFVSVVLFAIIFSLVIKILSESGVRFKNMNFILDLFQKNSFKSYTPTKNEYLKVFIYALLFRIFVLILGALIIRLTMGDSEALNVSNYIKKWVLWDSNNYIRIATLGYDGYWEGDRATTLVFFPLYSWFMKFFLLFVNNVPLSGLITSSFFYCLGSCYFYGLVSLEYGKSIAQKSLVLLSIFPFAFFLGAIMPESTFFFSSIGCLYYIKKHNWKMVALFGIMCTLSRIHGALLVLPAFIEYLTFYKVFQKIREKLWINLLKDFVQKALWIPTMLMGTLVYLYLNYSVTGNPFEFLNYQRDVWGEKSQYFGISVGQIFDRAFTSNQTDFIRVTIWLPEIFIFMGVVLLLILGFRRHAPKYLLYLISYTILSYSISWLISGPRYMTVALPMFFILGEISNKNKKLEKIILVSFSMLFGIYLWAYLNWKQVL